ncbi:MAG TPA: 4Fe-4S binding protein [Candidatus Binatia bacterium]|nr:4Fe-4S binding protein [Candidatus Binatia bacterium]
MPLSARGMEIASMLDSDTSGVRPGVLGCEILRHDELCVSCGRCVSACPTGAMVEEGRFDPARLFSAPAGTELGALGAVLRRIARHPPSTTIEVPERVRAFRSVVFVAERCVGCGACVRACPTGAVEARPVNVARVELPGRSRRTARVGS